MVSQNLDPENVRLNQIEWKQDDLEEMITSVIQAQKESQGHLKEIIQATRESTEKTHDFLTDKIETLSNQIEKGSLDSAQEEPKTHLNVEIASAAPYDEGGMDHISSYIPAGTIVRCVLVSAADCSVGVNQPKGPAMMLLRPLSNGHLPRNIRVGVKDSVILASAVGDLANERVYVRADRMTLVKPNGDFVETEISAYVSGEDGREGVRGVVVDRSGSIIARAAFASFMQGVGQSIQATLNNQTIEKLSKVGDSSVILDVDTYRNSGLQGANTALNKLADYYIKRSEQLQPSIQIAAGRTIDLIFTHGVKIGEKDLKKKFEMERALSRGKRT